MNKVFLSGTVESEPELRLETGKPEQATFRLSAWHRAEDGRWRREAYTVCCQDKRAYWAMVNIEAGQRIAVEGTLLGAGQVKIAAQEITFTFGRKRENGYTEDTKCGTTQGTRDDDADEGCEKEEPMETAEQTMELGGAQTEAQTPTLGKAQSNDGIDPRQRKWYDVGKRKGRTEASRARSAQGRNAASGDKDGNKDGRFSRMRKKLLSMMLALVMALGMAAIGGAEDAKPEGERMEGVQEELHMLWDIPWGSTPEEVRRLVQERAGIQLYIVGDNTIEEAKILKNGIQEITLLGVPIWRFRCYFENGGLKSIDASFLIDNKVGKRQFAADGISLIRNTYEAMDLIYGILTDSYLGAQQKKDGEYFHYYFPEDAGEIDYALISQVIEENEWLNIDLYWVNVKLAFIFDSKEGSVTGLFYWGKDQQENEYALDPIPYPKRNGYLTLEEELSRTGPAVNVGI